MSPSSTVIIAFCLLLTVINAQIKECTDSYQCSNKDISRSKVECSGDNSCRNTSIISNTTLGYVNCTGHASCALSNNLQSTKHLYCSGYKSCNDVESQTAKIIQCSGVESCAKTSRKSISADTLLYCGAERSCFNAQLTAGSKVYCEAKDSCINTLINAAEVNCHGKASCENAKVISTGIVSCGGEDACLNATITANDSVLLYGGFSGWYSKIINTPLIEAFGDSAINSMVIDSGELTEMTVKLIFSQWFNAGISVIICRNGAICNLICKGNACLALEYRCESGSVCNINPNGCKVNQGGVIMGITCPTITDGTEDSMITNADIYDRQFDRFHDDMTFWSEKLKRQTATLDDDDAEFIVSADATLCNIVNGCLGQTITDTDIACGGMDSCYDGTLTTTQSTSIIGCYGEHGCGSAAISAIGGNTLCLGEASCEMASIVSGRVRCSGLESCQDVSAIQTATEMGCGGTSSCKRADIVNTEADTDCTGNRACSDSTISSGFNIWCDGHYSCSNAELTSEVNIDCEATGSCHGTIANPNTHFYVSSYYGGYKSTIYPTDNTLIKAMGYHSLSFSTIDGENANSYTVQMFGHLSGYKSTVICRSGSECTLVCMVSGCKHMNFICEEGANCNIRPAQCNSIDINIWKGVECPKITTNIFNGEIDQIMKRIRYDFEKDEIYKRIRKDIVDDDLIFDSLRVDDDIDDNIDDLDDDEEGVVSDDDEEDEIDDVLIDIDHESEDVVDGDEQELFGQIVNEKEVSSNNDVILLSIVGVSFVLSLIYLWYKIKFIEYKSKKQNHDYQYHYIY